MVIRTKADLKECLEGDLLRRKKPKFWHRFVNTESYMLYNCFRNFRYFTYYKNNLHWYNFPAYLYHFIKWERYAVKYNIKIQTADVGPGLYMVHPGFLRVNPDVHIGKNVTILPNVLIGRRRPVKSDNHVHIGDNVYIATGVTILGPVRIGDNAIIAANSVVIKDVPDNCVVSGVPAKIIRQNGGFQVKE